ncbi:hypothetical protein [Phaeodactylibacter xiamenensis]|uniref:hypothetical protein n=1 Tax=Phaeodactylibacter xiamenensis TaxID=1524460 RepID=UPI0024A8B2E1|nr:hypothetical protein [Phaeodactylibacter xiamenensis]
MNETMQDTNTMPPTTGMTAMELAERLQLNPEDEFKAWRKLYKYLNSQGIKLSSGDPLPVHVEARVVQHYASNRNVRIANAARTLARERNIFLEVESLREATGPQTLKTPDEVPETTANPMSQAPESENEALSSIELQGIPYLISLVLAGVVFVGFDGFSAAMIVIQTYADIPEHGNRLHAISLAVQGLEQNPVLLYAVIMAILMGISIGYITIVTIVKWKGDLEYKNGLKALFSVFQFVLHLFAMPEKNIGMIILSVGLTLATFGVTVALDNAINGRA